MVAARSAAMGFNRLADQAIDARNPRTAGRELPRGVLSRGEAWAFVAISTAVFVLAAALLNPLCLALSPVALLIVFGYSYTKRFTAASQLVLGLSLAVAPVGAWLAIRGRFEAVPLVLGAAVVLWVAGFDTIYACQDADFDRREGLHSIPARLGVPRALVVARALHVGAILLLLGLYWLAPLHAAVPRRRGGRGGAARLGAHARACRRPEPRHAGLQPERLGEPRLLRVHRGRRVAGLRRRVIGVESAFPWARSCR